MTSSIASLPAEVGASAKQSWLGVWAIALGAFALVVTEFLPVGLLPGISRDLGISEGTAGLTVTSTALFAFIAAPITAMSIGRLDRRLVLIGLTGLLIVASITSSFAPQFPVLLAARVVLGFAIGGFWAIAVTAAAKLVPEDRVHAASSLVFAGISVGSVVSVPAGAYIGSHFDWRIAFMAASALAIVVALAQLAFLPRIVMAHGVGAAQFFGLLRSRRIRGMFLTILFIVSGQYAGYTFITPYLEQISGLSNDVLNIVLFAYGVMAVVGNFVGGALAGRNLQFSVAATAVLFALALTAVAIFASNGVLVVVSAMIWALAWGMAPVCTQLWLFASTRGAPEAAQAMNTSVFQLSIGTGSLIGGLAVNHIGLHSSMWFGAAILVLAVIMVFAVGRADRLA